MKDKRISLRFRAENERDMEAWKMLEEMAELYPVRENMTVYIPESEQEGELWSCYDKGKC